jgi:hypothetical protein
MGEERLRARAVVTLDLTVKLELGLLVSARRADYNSRMSSVPPPSSQPPSENPAPAAAPAPELVLALEESRGWRKPRRSESDQLRLSADGLSLEHGRVMQAPLELPLGAVRVAMVDPGPARASGQFGRFAVLRRLGPTSVIPRSEGIEGWLWTSTGGTGLTNLGEDDEAPNVALILTKPLDEAKLREAFDPEFVTVLAARSPLGSPTVLGVLFRVADTLAAEQGFRRWGFEEVLTDKEVPPTLRRHLPTDRPADPTVRGAGSDAARAATSVAPPGMS